MSVEKPIVVGTYNMSWASDQGNNDPVRGKSEALFLQAVNENNKREFWNNAKDHLMQFIKEKKPLAVGLQEMNVPLSQIEKLEKLKENNVVLEDDTEHELMIKNAQKFEASGNFLEEGVYGTLAIKKELNEKEYKIHSGVVKTPFGSNVSLAIILSSSEEQKKMKIVDQNNSGRPLLMILTTNDNLFVNMHGDQTPPFSRFVKEFNETMDKNIKFLQKKVEEFLGDDVPKNIYIMGDFNDRYNHIKNFTIKGKAVPLHIEEENVPKSCCFNIDSMGIEGTSQFKIFNNLGEAAELFKDKISEDNIDENPEDSDEKKENKAKAIDAFLVKIEEVQEGEVQEGEVQQDNDEKFGYLKSKQGDSKFTQGLRKGENAHSKIEEKEMSQQMRYKKIPFDDHGIAIENYVNMGDKVFSTNTITSLNIYTGSNPQHLSNSSNKSDHELVYAEISPSSEAEAPAEPAAEGGFFKSLFGGKKKTKKRKSSKKKTKKRKSSKKKTKKRKGKRKSGKKK